MIENIGNTGGNNSSFEDIMREGGVSDEFTSHRWDITGPLRRLSDDRS